MRKMKKQLCLALVFGLIFTSGVFSFADPATDDGQIDPVTLEVEETLEGESGYAESQSEEPNPFIPLEQSSVNLFSIGAGELRIVSVEVLNGGSMQALYRESVYLSDGSVKGEEAGKYYTTRREINLKDPRIFTVEFAVPASNVVDPDAFLSSVAFTYGGFPFNAWGNGNNLRGSTPIIIMGEKSIEPVDGDYVVTAKIRFNSPWATSGAGTNVPSAAQYTNGYIAGTQNSFHTTGEASQTGDHRAWWQAGPAFLGTGSYELAAVADGATLAARDLRIGPYDDHYNWIETNEFCQDLIEAITGSQIPITELDEKPIGMMAAGYVAAGAQERTYAPGNPATDVYVEVHILGYGHLDNYMSESYDTRPGWPANNTFNFYSRYNPIWNVVVAKDASTVDTYLNETLPLLNNNPQVLFDKYIDKDPKDIDLVTVYYTNNTHADEITGPETDIKLINDLIEGGKAGKIINYYTYDIDDIQLRYRYSSDTALYPTSTVSHYLKPGEGSNVTSGYGNKFFDPHSRTAVTFDTAEALDYFIMVKTLCNNPDGRLAVRRGNRYNMDLNRDVVFSTQPETIALTKDLAKWEPGVMHEWHGYVSAMLGGSASPPHAQTYEYDLLHNNKNHLTHIGMLATIGSTAYPNYENPRDFRAPGGWDDGGTIYGPMYAMLFDSLAYTVEFPHSNQDSLDAGSALSYSYLNALMSNTTTTAYYPGNEINGAMRDTNGVMRDSHEVDNKYTSLKKSYIMNKIESKLRAVNNIDDPAADKYFIDRKGGAAIGPNAYWEVGGRARFDNPNGGKLPFFPDYIIIPTDPAQQYNVAEGINVLAHCMERGGEVSVATDTIIYDGVTYPAGAYVIDMRQGKRNFMFEIMSKGYDATFFASMYADIYANFPDVRGFDIVQAWNVISGEDVFAGKIEKLTEAPVKFADISGTPAEYVIFKSQSTDAVRFVNLLLSGRSSGPSFAEKGNVWMLRNNLPGVANGEVGTKSDYVIETKDLHKINNLMSNPMLELRGCHIVGAYVSELPEEAVQLVEPKISLHMATTNTMGESTPRNALQGGPLFWILDDYLGFGSMVGYNGTASTTAPRPDANVVILKNLNAGAALMTEIKDKKLGIILIQNSSILTNANFGTGNTAAPATATAINDIALNGAYNISDSLFSANYEMTDTLYARGTAYTGGNLPVGAKELFRSLPNGDDAFIGGFQNISGNKSVFGDRLLAFSTILKGGGIQGKPIQSLSIGQRLDYRPHYHKLYPMLATAIFASAAGVLDDQIAPQITGIELVGGDVVVSATDNDPSDSGLKTEPYALYIWNSTGYEPVGVNATGRFGLVDGNRYKVEVTDWADNKAVALFAYLNGTFFVYDSESAVPSAAVTKLNGSKNDLTVTVKETFFNDGQAVFTRNLTRTFSIDNNSAGTYDFEGYKVYVDTKGNTEIRECYIVSVSIAKKAPVDATLTGAAAQFIGISETGQNSKVWKLSFNVTETYSNGKTEVVRYDVNINSNNANVSGTLNLGAYTLTYDIAGNGSNIKAFRTVLN